MAQSLPKRISMTNSMSFPEFWVYFPVNLYVLTIFLTFEKKGHRLKWTI